MNAVDPQKAQRKALARADRALCQMQVASWLGIRMHGIAAAMRANDITTPLDIQTAKRWVGGTEPTPEWFAVLLAERDARAARHAAAKAAQHLKDAQAERARADRVYRSLEEGKRRRFNDEEMVTVADVAFRASKDLVRGASVDELTAAELSALRVVGVNAHDHRTWWVHSGLCDGTGASCYPTTEKSHVALTLVPGGAT